MAEAWLLGQEPYLSSREIGQSVDEVEKLIKRHEAFEKSAATWDERFSALERLTTVSGCWTLRFWACWFSGAASPSCLPPRLENPHYSSVFKSSKDIPEIGDFLGIGPGDTIRATIPQSFSEHLGL